MSEMQKIPNNGAGRPIGSKNKISAKARQWARDTGELPHEFLLRVSRGEPILHPVINQVTGEVEQKIRIPTWDERKECAAQAAPYYAAKLQAIAIEKALSDAELDELIADAAAACSTELGGTGEGEEATSTPQEATGVQPQPAGRRKLRRPGTE